MSLFLFYGQHFLRQWLICKISILCHEIWKFKKGPKVAYALSKLIFTLRAAVIDILADFQTFIFGHEIWYLKTGPKVACVLSFYPTGLKLILFSLDGQPFSRYGLIFNITIFGHEICTQRAKLSLLSPYGQPISR